MARYGFIHDKLDIKILILFILQRLPEAISGETLLGLALCDEGFDYFDYSECLSELIETGHVAESPEGYAITEKGLEHVSVIESSLPYSVRIKVERAARPIASAMRRSAMIRVLREKSDNGATYVTLSLSDGVGDILSMRLLTARDEQAGAIESAFRAGAEGIYNKIIEMLSE